METSCAWQTKARGAWTVRLAPFLAGMEGEDAGFSGAAFQPRARIFPGASQPPSAACCSAEFGNTNPPCNEERRPSGRAVSPISVGGSVAGGGCWRADVWPGCSGFLFFPVSCLVRAGMLWNLLLDLHLYCDLFLNNCQGLLIPGIGIPVYFIFIRPNKITSHLQRNLKTVSICLLLY